MSTYSRSGQTRPPTSTYIKDKTCHGNCRCEGFSPNRMQKPREPSPTRNPAIKSLIEKFSKDILEIPTKEKEKEDDDELSKNESKQSGTDGSQNNSNPDAAGTVRIRSEETKTATDIIREKNFVLSNKKKEENANRISFQTTLVEMRHLIQKMRREYCSESFDRLTKKRITTSSTRINQETTQYEPSRYRNPAEERVKQIKSDLQRIRQTHLFIARGPGPSFGVQPSRTEFHSAIDRVMRKYIG